jgi:hypothetical protein
MRLCGDAASMRPRFLADADFNDKIACIFPIPEQTPTTEKRSSAPRGPQTPQGETRICYQMVVPVGKSGCCRKMR